MDHSFFAAINCSRPKNIIIYDLLLRFISWKIAMEREIQ